MKLVGITMIFAASAAIGFSFGDKYLSVLKGIKRTDCLLGTIILGLESKRLPLSEIFRNAELSGDEKTKIFINEIKLEKLEKASEIAIKCGFCADKTTNYIISESFCVLGKYSADEQIKEIEFYRKKLRAHSEKIEEQIKTKAKLSRYSGVFAGILITIILL